MRISAFVRKRCRPHSALLKAPMYVIWWQLIQET